MAIDEPQKNKRVGSAKSKASVSAYEEYHLPEYNMTVKARNIEEAIEKAKAIKNKEKEA